MNSKIFSAGLCSVMLLGAPAFAAGTGMQGTPAQTAPATSAQTIVSNAMVPVQRMKADKALDKLLARAKGVVIFPSVAKGAVVIGGSGGEGVLLARRGGQWSDPAFLSMGGASIGPQVGGKAGPVVMLLMTDKAVNDFASANNWKFNANAGLTIVNYSTKSHGGFTGTDVIEWSGAGGAYVGANIGTTDITSDVARDSGYYGHKTTTKKILNGAVHNAQAQPLIKALSAS